MAAEQAIHQTTEGRHRLPRVFRTSQLVMLGLGVMIGAGIFRLSGDQAATTAGPAVIVSFVIAAFVCLLAAFSFAELSSTIPAAGSVYTFSYVAMGEIWAWAVGWALILELLVAAALVARVWATYLVATIDGFDVNTPAWLVEHSQVDTGTNWVAFAMLLVLTRLIVTGTKLSARVLSVVVVAKIAVILFIIAVGARYVDSDNYTPFVPEHQKGGDRRRIGARDPARLVRQLRRARHLQRRSRDRVLLHRVRPDRDRRPRTRTTRAPASPAASSSRSAWSRSCTSPWRPCWSGCVRTPSWPPVRRSRTPSPRRARAGPSTWSTSGAVLALTTVVMVVLIAQSRVLFAMGRDGLLPSALGRVTSVVLGAERRGRSWPAAPRRCCRCGPGWSTWSSCWSSVRSRRSWSARSR